MRICCLNILKSLTNSVLLDRKDVQYLNRYARKYNLNLIIIARSSAKLPIWYHRNSIRLIG